MRGLQGIYILQTVKLLFVMKDGALRALDAGLCRVPQHTRQRAFRILKNRTVQDSSVF